MKPNQSKKSYCFSMTLAIDITDGLGLSTVLMIRVENCPHICFPIVNLLTSPLIVYTKFVWSIWFDQSNAKVGRKMSDDWLLS